MMKAIVAEEHYQGSNLQYKKQNEHTVPPEK
jgi:hypothetical protein